MELAEYDVTPQMWAALSDQMYELSKQKNPCRINKEQFVSIIQDSLQLNNPELTAHIFDAILDYERIINTSTSVAKRFVREKNGVVLCAWVCWCACARSPTYCVRSHTPTHAHASNSCVAARRVSSHLTRAHAPSFAL